VITDRIPQSGPLSGLDAALHDAHGDAVLLVAVDAPLLPVMLLQQLAAMEDTACFEVDGFVQPLPMRIPTSMRIAVEQALAANEFALLPLLRKLGLRTITVENASLFANVNTPEEFASVHETIQQNELRKGASD
jgi:molybdopterin-guanine dinucleotide biosynthesis protein A